MNSDQVVSDILKSAEDRGHRVVVDPTKENNMLRPGDKITVYNDAIIKYGVNAQMIQTVEEMCELGIELTKTANGRRDPWQNDEHRSNMVDELADVKVMIEQMEQAFQCHKEVQERMDYKIKRLKERMS